MASIDIAKIDRNFAVEVTVQREGLVFHDPREHPFALYGLFYRDGMYRRMPEDVAKSVSEFVGLQHTYCAGGRVRFVTDSPYIAIHAEFGRVCRMSHFPLTGSRGFDLYQDGIYRKTFVPPWYEEAGFESIYDVQETGMHEYLLHFPTYSEMPAFYIGLAEGCNIRPAPAYRLSKPVVFYGSSITQGGCSSRPGNAYSNIISRRLDVDHINLGFSGNAKGEMEMAEHIASLDMAAFVSDYDYNAPNAEHLAATHERLFQCVRKAHPDIPILLLPRPKFYPSAEDQERAAIVRRTYENAIAAGDRNVYFLSGPELMALCGNEGTVDGVHPTDFGFYSMAKAIGDVLEKVL